VVGRTLPLLKALLNRAPLIKERAGSRDRSNYSFIFQPPNVPSGVEIDVTRLLIEWFVVILFTGLLVWQMGRRGEP